MCIYEFILLCTYYIYCLPIQDHIYPFSFNYQWIKPIKYGNIYCPHDTAQYLSWTVSPVTFNVMEPRWIILSILFTTYGKYVTKEISLLGMIGNSCDIQWEGTMCWINALIWFLFCLLRYFRSVDIRVVCVSEGFRTCVLWAVMEQCL